MWKKGFCLVWIWFIFVSLGCFGKQDDVGRIKEVMGIFDRGMKLNSTVVLDLVCTRKVSQEILDRIYRRKGFTQPEMTERKFAIYDKKAEVSFTLRDKTNSANAPSPVKLYLKGRWGRWKIENFEMK